MAIIKAAPTFTLIYLILSTVFLSCVPVPRQAQIPLPIMLDRAKPLIASQHYGEAVVILEQAAEMRPNDTTALIKIGQIYLTQHRWFLAEDAFNRALARDLENTLAAAGLAETMFNQNRLNKAVELWKQVAKNDPELMGVFTGLGRTYLARFEFEAATEAFVKQLEHTPDDPEAYWYLAALVAPLDLSAAQDYLQAIKPELAPSLITRRDYLIDTLRPFDNRTSQIEVAKISGISMAQIGQWPLAVHALTIALEQSADEDVEILAFLGDSLAQAGRPNPDLFERAIKIEPDSILPLYFKGLYLSRQGELEAAIDLFVRAARLDPKNVAFYIELAKIKEQQGDFITTEALYKNAIELSDNDPQFQLLLLRFYANRSYLVAEAGIPLAEKILKKDKNNAEIYDLLGWMQFLSVSPDMGEVALRRAVQLSPNMVSVHYHLALLFEAKGEAEQAQLEYQRVVDLDRVGYFRERALKDLQR